MDKTSFFFTANCGVCHPGGAAMQYDRNGNLYFDRATGTYGYNNQPTLPASAQLDGDYGFINPSTGVPGTANWAKTGVTEADCVMCHMGQFATAPGTTNHNNGVSWHKRSGALRSVGVGGIANFEVAPTAGAGWAALTYQAGQSPPMAASLAVDYSLGLTAGTLVNDGGYLAIPLGKIGATKDANCRLCHSIPDGKKAGRTLLPTTDVHTARNVGCTRCHTAPNEGVVDSMGVAVANPHQIGKGDITIGSVRNDLDNTVKDCADCHLYGEDPLAPDPRPRHASIPGAHFSYMKCQTCHIRHLDDDPVSPTQDIPELVIEMTSNGTQNVSVLSAYLGTNPLDPSQNLTELGGRPFRWYPAIRWYKGKLTTVKPLYTAWFGEWLGGAGDAAQIRPIPLRLVRRAMSGGYAAGTARLASLPLTPGTKVATGAPILHRKDDIRASLIAMRDAVDTANPDATANDIVVRPVLVRADKVYYLNASDEVEYFESLVAESHDFAVNHNVVIARDPANPVVNPGPYGAGGCNDCHGPSSTFFYGKQLAEPAQYDYLDEHGTVPNPEAGRPSYRSHYEAMGYSEARAGFLTGKLVPVHVRIDSPYGAVTATDGVTTRTFGAGTAAFAARAGSTVTLTATAAGGATFAGFTGCAAGGSPDVCTLDVGTPASGLSNPGVLVAAAFGAPAAVTPDAYSLIVRINGQGSVSGGGINCQSNAGACGIVVQRGAAALTLVSTANVSGFTFAGFTGCSSVSGNACTVSVTGNTLVTATYEPTSFPIAVRIEGGSGSVRSSDAGATIDCRDNTFRCTASVPRGGALAVSATANPGSTFVSWTGCPMASGATCTFENVGTGATLKANFSRP